MTRRKIVERTLEGISPDAKEVWVRGNPRVRIDTRTGRHGTRADSLPGGTDSHRQRDRAAKCRLRDAGRGPGLRRHRRLRLQFLRRPRRPDRPPVLPRSAGARPGAGQAPGAARPRPAPGPGGRHPSRLRGDALRLPVRRPGAGAAARRRPPRRPRGLHPPSAQAHARLRGGRRLRPAGFHRLPARGHRRPAAVALRHHGRVHGARRRRRAAAAARRPTSSPTCSTPRAAPASRAAR